MTLVKKTTDMDWPEADALWLYTSLPEPLLSSELERLSFAQSTGDTDVITFQPCPNPELSSQDRFVVQDWPMSNGTWLFRAVFDGHVGHETVDYASSHLPYCIQTELAAVLAQHSNQPEPSLISDALKCTISTFDVEIGQELINLFPNQEILSAMSDQEIQSIINDDGRNSTPVARCMRGTTALISLLDPTKTNIWVASLGDCAAVLGSKGPSGQWETRVLSSKHNGENPTESLRVQEEHPGESECILEDRVLGAIAVTRAIGDFSFKLPAVYTERIFLNSDRGFLVPEKVRSFIGRNITPPYVSGTPEVRHLDLKSLDSRQAFLIMCTDGLMDLYDTRLELDEVLAKRWVDLVGENSDMSDGKNLALKLLRDALGGDDCEKVSRMITVEMAFRWMDDTTVLVSRIQ